MNESEKVLETAYEALNQEFQRISNLILADAKNPLNQYGGGKYAVRVNEKFSELESEFNGKLVDLKTAIKEKRLDEGWNLYVELKTVKLPVLSSELLAVLGGVYLMDVKLDNLRLHSKQESLSFSALAEKLVIDLGRRSGKGWASVLIVGEERFSPSQAEIIRLRFPACDLWNLPFTAHEYGYLVAQNKPPQPFKELVEQAIANVNPAKHELVGEPPVLKRPANEACFLVDVKRLWDRYHDELKFEDDRVRFLDEHEAEFAVLEEQQKSHLCRLFADAFATFFLGPAYVLALLNLQFQPDHTLYQAKQEIPPFAVRFAFALETLKWMNNEPISPFEKYRGTFQREVDEQTGIPGLWRATLASAKQEDRYAELIAIYASWIQAVKEGLQDNFRSRTAIQVTYTNFQVADKELGKQLSSARVAVEKRPNILQILNAAWVALWENPERRVTIQENAWRLIDEDDQSVIVEAKSRPGSGLAGPRGTGSMDLGGGAGGESGTTREADVRAVKSYLSAEAQWQLLQRFRQMADRDKFSPDEELQRALGANDDAIDAFRRLIQS